MKKRILWLDNIRAFAIMLVVLCHCAENTYFYSGVSMSEHSLFSQFFCYFSFTLGRIGVPLFLAISGYLLLSRTYDSEQCLKFWKHNLIPLFIASEIWIVCYYFFMCFMHSSAISLSGLIKNMLFLGLEKISYLWYLPMILGIYICIPLLATALQKINVRLLFFPITVVYIYCFIIPTANKMLALLERTGASVQIFLYFTGGIYGLYLIIGYMFYKKFTLNMPRWIMGLGVIINVLIMALFQLYLYYKGYSFSLWYDFPLLPIASILLFQFLKDMELPDKIQRLMTVISKYSFAIYLIHKPIQILLEKYFPLLSVKAPVKLLILWFFIFILSFIGAFILSRIKWIGKYLFLL